MTGNGMDSPARTGGGAGSPADLGPRFLARLIDGLLLWVVLFVIVVPLFVALSILGSAGSALGGFGFSFGQLVFLLIAALLNIGYFALMESQMGKTVGKMVMGLQTLGPDGNNPTLEEATKRNLWYALGIVPIIGGLLELAAVIYIMVTISQSPQKIGWHDVFAGGTRVVTTK